MFKFSADHCELQSLFAMGISNILSVILFVIVFKMGMFMPEFKCIILFWNISCKKDSAFQKYLFFVSIAVHWDIWFIFISYST